MNRRAGLALLFVFLCIPALAQTRQKTPQPSITSALCTRANAIDGLQQQVAFSKTFDNPLQRIAVLLRSADLLWPYDRDKSLAVFNEAYEIAKQHFREKGDDEKQDSKFLRSTVPDQRFKVIRALAKRSPADARKLSDQLLDEAKEAENDSIKTNDSKYKLAEKLLEAATDLLSKDVSTSTSYARTSLRYPATLFLTMYTYGLAKVNRSLADQFYEEALAAYANTPMKEFLYLSAYPFGNSRDAGEMPSHTFYGVPSGFSPNPRLQRMFVQQLLARLQTTLAMPVEAAAPDRYSDAAQMWMAFTRLENQIGQSLPDLAPAATAAKEKLFALLTPDSQTRVNERIASDNPPKLTFDEQVEAAEKTANEGQRDWKLTAAVISSASKDAPIEKVIAAIEKISDSNVRPTLFSWFYFKRSEALIAEEKFEEARKLADKTTELDQRAFLYAKIAEGLLKENEDQTQARELLNELSDTASKAPKTVVTARAMLATASLYARIDPNRGVEELGRAVKVINSLTDPDFSVEYVMLKIEGKTFGTYSAFSTPGFSPENVFKDVGKIDFDGSLVQAATFSDKSLRALTTIAVIEPCLEIAPSRPKTSPKKP